jgi:hypothetical protein
MNYGLEGECEGWRNGKDFVSLYMRRVRVELLIGSRGRVWKSQRGRRGVLLPFFLGHSRVVTDYIEVEEGVIG